MGWITLEQAASWCGGRIDPKYAQVAFWGANNDSRNIQKDQLFIALQGARDGHDFIPSALQKGAAAVLCNHCDGDYPAIVVEDTRIALGQIAREERKRIGMKVVGVTGSVGKSTTKAMIACVLSGAYRVAKTPANHNNDIGMPMAVLSIPDDTQVAVLEMGMNHFREIAYLSAIAMPDVAVIVNIGTMHIEHLGSVEGILQAKMEIMEGMDASGKVILNGDDGMLWGQHENLRQAIYFGANNEMCAVLGKNVQSANEQIKFDVSSNRCSFSVTLPLEGQHYVSDALAAISVGLELSVEPACISAALSGFQNADGRQQILQINGYTIIKDCYNAGPESMAAALAVLRSKSGRRIAVLGDMLELGDRSQAEHDKVGGFAAECADFLLAYGPNSAHMLNGAIAGGMTEKQAKAFVDREELVDALKRFAKPGDAILVKGSRGMRMELALEQFLKNDLTPEDKG